MITVNFGKKQYTGGFNVSCKGYDDGKAWIQTISGGNGGYSYFWYTSDGSITGSVTTDTIRGLTSGKYYLITTDSQGCTKTDSVEVFEPNGMVLLGYELSKSADGDFNISCIGGNDGYIKLTITGGSGNYLYSWSNGGTTGRKLCCNNLRSGEYDMYLNATTCFCSY
jgi:hypothetical protein